MAAIAIPLNLPERECFVSYNIEANYGMPIVASDIIPGKLKRLRPVENDAESAGGEGRSDHISGNATEVITGNNNFPTNLLSRQKFYTLLIRKFNA